MQTKEAIVKGGMNYLHDDPASQVYFSSSGGKRDKEGGAGWWNDPDRPHHGQMALQRRKSEIKQWEGNREVRRS